MEFKKKKIGSRGKKILIVVLVVALVLGGGYWAWMTFGEGSSDNTASQKDTENEDEAKDNESADESSNSSNQSPSIEPDKNVQTDRPATGETLNVWITSKDIINGTLRIRVQIDQNISGGTCTLAIGSYTTSVPVAFEPQSASCQGFDVLTSAYSGNSFTITVQDGNKSGSVKGDLP
ncbi:hypothetical protein FWG95_00375 [Candidatus Saccharibacteria bacterium]|nr:hypothetical protein [Candidatus Saccharibacteria bacterium]